MIFLLSLFLSLPLHAAENPTDQAREEALKMVAEISQELDNELREIAKRRSGPGVGAALIQLMMKPRFSWVDFYVLEGRFRRLQTQIFLVAAPIKFAPGGDDVCARALYGVPEGDLPYWLWVEIHGEEKMKAQLKEFGIESYEANLENLKRTGILMERPR